MTRPESLLRAFVLFGRAASLLGAGVFTVSLMVSDARAAPDEPLLLRHMPLSAASDEAVIACACPGAVSFCTEWKEKWAKDVKDPKIRNQTVRECVVDFMSSVMGRPWP